MFLERRLSRYLLIRTCTVNVLKRFLLRVVNPVTPCWPGGFGSTLNILLFINFEKRVRRDNLYTRHYVTRVTMLIYIYARVRVYKGRYEIQHK